jgi:asparagine synthase (glutamine-hydrolysing)
MCGIAGFLLPGAKEREALTPTIDALRSRGPDEQRISIFAPGSRREWKESEAGQLGLVHTRLSIRDLSERGGQPMCNEDRSVWLAYNGEIYGWERERQELEAAGHRFKSETDTEFIVHGYEEWGEAVLERMRGMFAFVLMDLRKRRIFAARDRLGKKPLFYTCGKAGLGFASTVKALASMFPGGTFGLCVEAIDAFLAHRYIPAPLSIFEGVRKLPPATKLTLSLDEPERTLKLTEYWRPSPIASTADDLWREFQESIRLRLASDRPLGLFLSSGIDSQCVAKGLVEIGQKDLVRAYTAAFPESPEMNEGPAASAFARELGLRHTNLDIRLESEGALRAVESLDEPFADPSALPTWALCREATRHVKVALTGDGGDELFAGYKRYYAHLKSARWNVLRAERKTKDFHRRGGGGTQRGYTTKKTVLGKVQRILMERQMSWGDAYVLRFSGLDPGTRMFLQPERTRIRAHYWRLPEPQATPLEWMLECDRLNYLPEYILKKSDACGMAHGLELRSPLLDQVLFQRVMGLPREERFTDPPKGILRRWLKMGDTKRRKMGFNPPLQEWFATEQWKQEIAGLPTGLEEASHGQLDHGAIGKLVEGYRKGEIGEETVWQLIVLRRAIEHLRK